MARFNQDTLAGLILLAYSLVHVFFLTPDQVEMHRDVVLIALSPRLFCYITGGSLGFLSLVLVLLSLRPGGAEAAEAAPSTSWQPIMRGLFSTAMASAYVALASVLGFFVSTALAMTAFLIYFGVRKWTGIVFFQVVVLGFIYLLFVKGLKVVMPDGLFF